MDTLRLTVENYTFDKYFPGKGGEGGKGEWEGDAHPCRKRKREVKAFWCMLVIPSHMLNMEAHRRKINIFGVTINRQVVFCRSEQQFIKNML